MTARPPLVTPRPRAAIFISYRQSDGSPAAARLAWALRATGLPVWHDQTDLPPGDTVRVISQALASGLSGAVLVVTDDIVKSPVVKNIEWPRIRQLSNDGNFTLGVLNAIRHAKGSVYAEPDRLLRRLSDRILRRFRHHLSGLKQYRSSSKGDQTDQLAADMLRQRLHHLAPSIRTRGHIEVSLTTRAEPTAEYAEAADLTFCWDRAEAREVSATAQQIFQRTFHVAAGALRQHTAGTIRFRGQAHLSFGLAIGASLALGPAIEFANDDGLWSVSRHRMSMQPTLVEVSSSARASTGPVLVYVDLLKPASRGAYDALARSGGWSERVHVERHDRESHIPSSQGDQLAHEIAAEVRSASARNRNAQVHLLLYAPLPIAVLVGTLLNTLDVVVYEWDRGGDGVPASYAPKFRLRPGELNPITLPD
ncbi:hypothetical protein SRABI98_00026 [Microbacterium sp. Bi98]|uniref:SAVED domain-containing protein n=1 Tax=Microbacterium sp. Bi98 TaxID=2821116 RepID=UPI001D807A2D|nr:SAVED domain-containing protein [Microbacterium sp. Bi98]CAH0123683.1 hypothetical protein SRABI98_00026 [Microbacterium sp. Bi98]